MKHRLSIQKELPLGIAATITLLVVLYYFYEFHFVEICTYFGISIIAAAAILWRLKRGDIKNRPFEKD